MLRRIVCIFLPLIIVALNALAQERPFILQPYEQFTTDIQENIYCWNNDRLDLYSPDGKLRLHYSNPKMGEISKVDAAIPTKVMIYYEEANSIILLNNKLAEIGNPINLFDEGIRNPVLACMFGINRIACYDEANQKIYLIDLDLKKTDVVNCQFEEDFHPQHIIADQNFESLILCDSATGLAIFDRLATYQKWIPVQGIQHMQLQNNNLYFLKDNNLYSNNLNTLWSPTMIIGLDQMVSFSKVLSNWYVLLSSGTIHKISIRR
ncbi:MAG: hypothetical protein K6A41_01135 [Bacteroidales bacterium]|nr:hypothetical protein [Bacteroidales bacterium]